MVSASTRAEAEQLDWAYANPFKEKVFNNITFNTVAKLVVETLHRISDTLRVKIAQLLYYLSNCIFWLANLTLHMNSENYQHSNALLSSEYVCLEILSA